MLLQQPQYYFQAIEVLLIAAITLQPLVIISQALTRVLSALVSVSHTCGVWALAIHDSNLLRGGK